MSDVTRLSDAAAAGDRSAAADLLPLVYDELRAWRVRGVRDRFLRQGPFFTIAFVRTLSLTLSHFPLTLSHFSPFAFRLLHFSLASKTSRGGGILSATPNPYNL